MLTFSTKKSIYGYHHKFIWTLTWLSPGFLVLLYELLGSPISWSSGGGNVISPFPLLPPSLTDCWLFVCTIHQRSTYLLLKEKTEATWTTNWLLSLSLLSLFPRWAERVSWTEKRINLSLFFPKSPQLLVHSTTTTVHISSQHYVPPTVKNNAPGSMWWWVVWFCCSVAVGIWIPG